MYIMRDDTSNAIYSFPDKKIFCVDSQDFNKTYILKIIKDRDDICIEYCDSLDYMSKNYYVVFTKDSIYILDFANREFGKYFRTLKQYVKLGRGE